MREELKAVMREVRRNEALIEFMEIKGMLPKPMRSIGDVTKSTLLQQWRVHGGCLYELA